MSIIELAETLMRLERIGWSKAILIATQRKANAAAARQREQERRRAKLAA